MKLVMRVGVLAAVAAFMAVGSARAQDPLKLPGKNYSLVFENSEVVVIRAHYGPHEKIPVHDHTSYSTVFVYLDNSGPVRINHEEAGATEAPVIRPPTVKGAYRVAPGIAERHSIENLGDFSSDFLRVELKHASLTMKEPFRGKAPGSFNANEDVVEFEQQGVKVERIVCVGAEVCEVRATAAPSVVVAFSRFGLSSTKTHRKEMVEAGAVRWVPAGDEMTVVGYGVAHLLRIILPESVR